jgi:hypothetical protein
MTNYPAPTTYVPPPRRRIPLQLRCWYWLACTADRLALLAARLRRQAPR